MPDTTVYESTINGGFASIGKTVMLMTSLSLTIINMTTKTTTQLCNTIHPGEILLEEFLQPLQISQYRLAKEIQVPPRRINEIVHGTRGVTADTALRLAQYFGTTAQFWMNLQNQYDLTISAQSFNPSLEEFIRPLTAER